MSDNFQKKHSVLIDGMLYDEIKKYCDLNSLRLNEYINKLIKKGFDIERYGDTPFCLLNKEAEEKSANANIPDAIIQDAIRRFQSKITIDKNTGEVDMDIDKIEEPPTCIIPIEEPDKHEANERRKNVRKL